MNLKISNKGIASGLAISTLLATFQGQAGSTELDRFVDANSIQAFDHPQFAADVESDGTNSVGSTVVIEVPSEPVWDDASQTRFEELAGKIALDVELGENEQLEYRKLRDIRRRTHPSRSYDEIVADQELHKRVCEAVSSIKNLIEYATRSVPSEIETNRF